MQNEENSLCRRSNEYMSPYSTKTLFGFFETLQGHFLSCRTKKLGPKFYIDQESIQKAYVIIEQNEVGRAILMKFDRISATVN